MNQTVTMVSSGDIRSAHADAAARGAEPVDMGRLAAQPREARAWARLYYNRNSVRHCERPLSRCDLGLGSGTLLLSRGVSVPTLTSAVADAAFLAVGNAARDEALRTWEDRDVALQYDFVSASQA